MNHAVDELEQLRSKREVGQREDVIIGDSEAIQSVLRKISRVARTTATVLIYGETGTGKELVAQQIHRESLVADRPMVTVNCATLTEDLIESELFGHERGAFTGAYQRHIGKFEQASGSTLFLDEISSLSLVSQSKLLRVLEAREFDRVGGNSTIFTSARIIAATNERLETLVQAGDFRSDLFYRLSVFPIVLPSLRDRKEDIDYLAHHFMHLFSNKYGRFIEYITSDAIAKLMYHRWPGNIRELSHCVECAVINSDGYFLEANDFLIPTQNINDSVFFEDKNKELSKRTREFQKKIIVDALIENGWNVSVTAKVLNVHRNTLFSKIKELGIRHR